MPYWGKSILGVGILKIYKFIFKFYCHGRVVSKNFKAMFETFAKYIWFDNKFITVITVVSSHNTFNHVVNLTTSSQKPALYLFYFPGYKICNTNNL